MYKGIYMDRNETKEIICMIAGIYPSFYKDASKAEKSRTVDLWASLFSEEPFELVSAALKSFIVSDEKGFAPSPGQLKAKIRTMLEPSPMTEVEAWQIVSKAIRNSGYMENARAEHEKLPELIKRIVKPEQLREWALQDASSLQTVVASNFMRSFREKSVQADRYERLPADVKAAIGKFTVKEIGEGQ